MTNPESPKRQLVAEGIFRRAGYFPELHSLDKLVAVFRTAGVPWGSIARLASDWSGHEISGERLRVLYGPREGIPT